MEDGTADAAGGFERNSSRRPAKGRICAEAGCETKLSIYNDGAHCSLHAPMITPRTRGRKIA